MDRQDRQPHNLDFLRMYESGPKDISELFSDPEVKTALKTIESAADALARLNVSREISWGLGGEAFYELKVKVEKLKIMDEFYDSHLARVQNKPLPTEEHIPDSAFALKNQILSIDPFEQIISHYHLKAKSGLPRFKQIIETKPRVFYSSGFSSDTKPRYG